MYKLLVPLTCMPLIFYKDPGISWCRHHLGSLGQHVVVLCNSNKGTPRKLGIVSSSLKKKILHSVHLPCITVMGDSVGGRRQASQRRSCRCAATPARCPAAACSRPSTSRTPPLWFCPSASSCVWLLTAALHLLRLRLRLHQVSPQKPKSRFDSI